MFYKPLFVRPFDNLKKLLQPCRTIADENRGGIHQMEEHVILIVEVATENVLLTILYVNSV